jgi:hypothetical protein
MKKIISLALAFVCSAFLISNSFALEKLPAPKAYFKPHVISANVNGQRDYLRIVNNSRYAYQIWAVWEGHKPKPVTLEYADFYDMGLAFAGSTVQVYARRVVDGAVLYNWQTFPAGDLAINDN